MDKLWTASLKIYIFSIKSLKLILIQLFYYQRFILFSKYIIHGQSADKTTNSNNALRFRMSIAY